MAISAKSIRRVVAGEEPGGKAVVFSDAPSPDVTVDPARPGFYSSRLWVTDATPARTRNVRDTLHLPRSLTPPRNGSVLRYVEFPPDRAWLGAISEAKVRAYFASSGSPDASTFERAAPHPYMQKTQTLDICHVIEGEITLVLDTEEVLVRTGDTVIQRGTNHAWSNRTDRPCIMAITSFDAKRG